MDGGSLTLTGVTVDHGLAQGAEGTAGVNGPAGASGPPAAIRSDCPEPMLRTWSTDRPTCSAQRSWVIADTRVWP